MPQRFDSGSIATVKKTPQGGLRVDAFLTRSGIFQYKRPDGTTIREYRSDEEVFKAESVASLASAPVTLLHPPAMVRPGNFQKHSRGNVHGEPRKDGDKLSATLMIQDTQAIKAVEMKHAREVSCGYHCDTDDTPGTTPSGEHYDRAQINILYNHVALVPRGRAGREVRLRLDADDNQLADDPPTQPQVKHMKKVRIDGVEYEIGTDSYIQARDRQLERLTQERTDAIKLSDEQKARADHAEKAAKGLQEKLDTATSPDTLSKLVNARADLVTRAVSVLGEEKLDGLSNRDIHIRCLTKLDSEIRLDSESDDYVRATFNFATKAAASGTSKTTDKTRRDANAARLGAGDSNKKSNEGKVPRTAKEARNDMIERSANAWETPLSTSTRS